MEKIILFLTVLCYALSSCTKEKTDYEAEMENIVPDPVAFEEVASFQKDGYTVSIKALGGQLYKGYNEIRLIITGNELPKVSAATLLPILTSDNQLQTSAPHRHNLLYNADAGYFEGFAVFTDVSSETAYWELHIGFDTGNLQHHGTQRLTIHKQDNKNLNIISFMGNDGEQYLIALVAPQNPKVAENILTAGIYKLNKVTTASSVSIADPALLSYSEVNGYTLLLDPRMPEPSMGNHSSPNNKDLVQGTDKLYHGIVNYTMTGNWTLNLILLNHQGRILKGTIVPDDFTPGVTGLKSDLHIDILF